MSPETRDLVTWILGTTLSISAIIGLVVKFVLMPYLRNHLVEPMKQVEKQVSENHHSNLKPTVLDRIDDVQQSVQEMRSEIQVMSSMYEGHVNWSEKWSGLVERELDFVKNMLHHRNDTTD